MRKVFLMVGLVMLFGSSVCLAVDLGDADLQFVDMRDDTGYYVDVNSIVYTNDHELTADVAMIKPLTNRMFLYGIHFDSTAATYQILNSKVMRYDTKEQISGSNQALPPSAYGDNSPMKNIVDYIYSLRKSS